MQQYQDALKKILEERVVKKYDIETDTKSIFGHQMRFDMSEGFPAVTTKKLYFDAVKKELIWFLSGSRDSRELEEQGVKIWNGDAYKESWRKKAEFKGDVGRIYGVQWRSWRTPDGKEIDQLSRMIERIKQKPNDRRFIITAWNPGELEEMALPPCHLMYQFYVADGKLSLQMYQRSADMFLGVPFNIASYSLLLHMVAQVTELEPGEFIHVLGDAHIYTDHIEQVEELLERETKPLPKLKLNEDVKDIDKFRADDIELEDYEYHPPLRGKMSVNTDFEWDEVK